MKEKSHRKAARRKLCAGGYKAGGHVKAPKKMVEEGVEEHEEHLHKGQKKTKLKLKDGGMASGGKPKHRADKAKRGAHVTVNVVNAGHKDAPRPIPVPVPAGPGGPPPGMMGPGGPMPPPPDGGPGGPMPPPGMKRGGRARVEDQRDEKGGMPAGHFKRGGKTKGSFTVPMKDGAGGGLGRLAKKKAYGA